MARTVNEQEYASKRNDILDAMVRLIFAKGYERTTIQEIRAELKISSGAFYHYFDSKPALLEAFIERMREVSEKQLLPVISDPHLTAIEKMRGFFDAFERLRIARKEDVVRLGRVWYMDENAIIRQKVEQAVAKQRAPLVAEIVRQGVQEGVFTTAYPDQAGEVVMALLQGMGNTHARLLLSAEPEGSEQDRIDKVVTTYAAYMNAIERVLGAPQGSLQRADVEEAKMWMNMARDNV